jgi:hypothetical protein
LANIRKFFPDVDSRFKFSLLGLKKGGQTERFKTMFLISRVRWPRTTLEEDASAVMERILESAKEYIFEMDIPTIRRFSPSYLSLMEFKSRRDYTLADKIYSNHPLLGDTLPDTWNVKFTNEFHMTNDRHLFNTHGAGLPLYEGKMIHQFDAYWAPPQYWIKATLGEAHLVGKKETVWFNNYRFAFREVTNSTNERTSIVSMLPPKTFSGHTLWVGTTQDQRQDLFYTAICNSFCFDWVARLQVDTHMNLSIMEQLPMPRLKAGNPTFESIVERATRLTCTHPDFAQLWESVMGTAWDASQAVTEPLARQALRDELDALVARLYGLSRSDFDHLLGTFPQVFPPNEQGRDKRERLLSVFDSTPPLTEHSS